ncbi:hypothetical protein D3C80_1508180 [compost metagenome]
MLAVCQIPGTPDRTDTLGMSREQNAMRGTTGRQTLLRGRNLEVILQTRNHHHQQRRTQWHGPGLVQSRLTGVTFNFHRFGQQRAQLFTPRPFNRQEAPRPQLGMVRRPQRGLKQSLALCGIGRGFHQAWYGNTVEQCVESLHRLPPKEKCAAILAFT